jgi:anti-anti-sigma factor
MDINREDQGNITIISFDGEDQFYDPEPLQKAIQIFLDEGRTFLLIDFETIGYISSSVLGCLITTYRELKEKNGQLKVLNVQPSVSNVFEITRLNRIIEMFNDRDKALKSFG